MARSPSAPIGIFDSGLGGLTVAAAVAARLPHERIVYLGDTARVPYGTRSPATVVRYARNNVAFLRQHGVKLVVVACNTVSAQGLGGLADGGLEPIVGVIRPGARAALAASRGGELAVLGTPATIRSGAYPQAVDELEPGRRLHTLACPLFVPLVEEGWTAHPIAYHAAREYLAPLCGAAVDTVILGCTHYPLLRGVIAEVAGELLGRAPSVIDSATAVAEEVAHTLDALGLRREPDDTTGPLHRFFVTDAPDRVEDVGARFWGAPLGLEHVDVVDRT